MGEWGPVSGSCLSLCLLFLCSLGLFPSLCMSHCLLSGSLVPFPAVLHLAAPPFTPQPLPRPLSFPASPDTRSSPSWPWSLRNVNWLHALPVTGLELGWGHPPAATSAPLIPSMRTSLPSPSRWAPPTRQAPHRRASEEGWVEGGTSPAGFSLPSQVRSERPLFSSNPELDNLVRPKLSPTLPPTMDLLS